MKGLVTRPDIHDWQARADDALELARAMPPGAERIAAFKKAGLLRDAAAAKAVFSPSRYVTTAPKAGG
ncbi:MAG: hypothetical protein JWO28_44 [Hyphomicrobiales bacterium]|jgi:hypothetical protein|nr:hypothetical protein [Hyphomicrobiales bacterium]